MFSEVVEELLELSAPELDEVVREAELTIRRADVRLAAAAAIVGARQSYRDEGHYSLRAYLKAHTNCSGTRANRIRRRSSLVDAHAEIGSAWAAGHIGTDQVDTLAKAFSHPRAGERFDEFAPLLLDHAEHLEHVDFEKVVDQFITLADTDGAFDDQQFQEDERMASVAITNGAVDVRATGGDALAAAEMDAVFKLACEAEFERDCASRRAEFGDDGLNHPLPRTLQQRRFDALHRIFLAWATVPADGQTPEPLVNVVVDHRTAGEVLERHGLTDGADIVTTDQAGGAADAFDREPPADAAPSAESNDDELLTRRCATSTGTAVHPDVALKAMIRGRVRRVIVDGTGVIVDLGRKRRLFTGSAREAAQLLVTTCSHPGCEVPAEFCDVDHLDEWVAHGGATDQRNGGPMCGGHDRFKHDHQLRARRTVSGRIRLIRPDGSVIKPAGERDPVWADDTGSSRPDVPPPFDERRLVPWPPLFHETPTLFELLRNEPADG